MLDENEIVKQAVSGDEDAFEQIIKLYQKQIFSLALRMTGNHDDAYDISQEVFIRVYRSLPGFKGESKLSTWIYRIASNLCIDFKRKSSKVRLVSLDQVRDNLDFDGPSIESAIPDDRYSPERAIERTEINLALERAVEALSPEHREIFLMREVNGLTYAEIAEIKQIEEGTVKSRLFRAREKLRELLLTSGNISGYLSSNGLKGGE